MRRTLGFRSIIFLTWHRAEAQLLNELILCASAPAPKKENPLFQVFYLSYMVQGGILAYERNLVSVALLLLMRRTLPYRPIVYSHLA
jgi:hypothetical protein